MRALAVFLFASLVATGACSGGGVGDELGDADAGRDDDADAASSDGASDTFVVDVLFGDAPPACTVGGVSGVCIDVAYCKGDHVATPGHCAGPANVQCCTLQVHGDATAIDAPWDGDTTGWCPTDPTARPNDGLVEVSYDARCPTGMITVSTYCVDKYEAEIVVKNSDGTESSWSPYYPPPSGRPYRAVSLENAVPQGYMSGVDAKAACEASGKRLCTNDEWLRACQGPTGTTFPYGDTREPGVCNDHRDVHPAIECFGTSASWIWSALDWPGIDQQPVTVDRTGSRTGCVTAEGAFDMMGNLHEWVDDPTVNFRGGYYVDTVENGPGCLYQTTAHAFSHWDYSTGFRCCADRKP